MAPRGQVDGQGDTAFWVIRCGVAFIFVAFGIDKFDTRPNGEWVTIFARIGFGQWFRIFTGWVEITGGLLLLPPLTRRAGAALLGVTMLGAAIAHVTRLGDPVAAIVPLVLGGIAVATGLHEAPYDIRNLTGRRHRSASRQRSMRSVGQ